MVIFSSGTVLTACHPEREIVLMVALFFKIILPVLRLHTIREMQISNRTPLMLRILRKDEKRTITEAVGIIKKSTLAKRKSGAVKNQ